MIPHYFAMTEEQCREFARTQQAGTLVTCRPDGGFDSTLMPFIWQGDTLQMHMGRANPQWQNPDPGPHPAIFILTGAHGYISARDYDVPAGMSSPSTWDYTQVALHGQVEFDDDAAAARTAAVELSYQHDAEVASALTESYLTKAARAIIAVTFTIERIEGIAKLSQNKLPYEREAIAARLSAGNRQQQQLAADIRAVPSTARRVPFKRPEGH